MQWQTTATTLVQVQLPACHGAGVNSDCLQLKHGFAAPCSRRASSARTPDTQRRGCGRFRWHCGRLRAGSRIEYWSPAGRMVLLLRTSAFSLKQPSRKTALQRLPSGAAVGWVHGAWHKAVIGLRGGEAASITVIELRSSSVASRRLHHQLEAECQALEKAD